MRWKKLSILIACLLSLTLWAKAMAQGPTPTPIPPTGNPVVDTFNLLWTRYEKLLLLILGGIGALFARKILPWLWRQLGRLWRTVTSRLGFDPDGRFERECYLEWLVNEHCYLGTLPSNVVLARRQQGADIPAELEKVYVHLSLGGDGAEQSLPSDIPFPHVDKESKGKPGRLARLLRWEREPFRAPGAELGTLLATCPRLIILGDPGSGKTTLLRYLTVTAARARLRERQNGQPVMEARLGLARRPLPIFVRLNRCRDVAQWEKTGKTLIDAFEEQLTDYLRQDLPEAELKQLKERLSEEELNAYLRRGMPTGFFERRLKKGSCWVLLDGFDELATREARAAMARQVQSLANAYGHPDNRFVVTSRIKGYQGQLAEAGFAARTLEPLGEGEIAALVRHHYRILKEANPADYQEKRRHLGRDPAEHLLGELKKHPGLRRIADNPLLLTLIVLVHSVGVELPERRNVLYRDCVEILAERWRQTERPGLRLTLDQKVGLLAHVALEMHSGPAGQDTLPRSRVEQLIAERLVAFWGEDKEQTHPHKAAELLEWTEEQHGLLVERGFDERMEERLISFSHLTFQEYLAARAIESDARLLPRLCDHLHDDWWREVLLLYVGLPQAQTDQVLRVLLPPGQPPALPGLLLAGRCLAEEPSAYVDPILRRQVLEGLQGVLASEAEAEALTDAAEVLALCGREEVAFLLDTLRQGQPAARAAVARALGRLEPGLASRYEVKEALVAVTEEDSQFNVRLAAAHSLGTLGDPRLGQLVAVPAGEFTMGSEEDDDERPPHRVFVSPLYIGKYPVTNTEYKEFVDATGHPEPRGWQEGFYPAGKANHPVVNVTWYDAQAYCRWLTGRLREAQGILRVMRTDGREEVLDLEKGRYQVRLPTEAEWEKAARGTDGRRWPWGDEWDAAQCNTEEGKIRDTTPVGIYPGGASPYGALDMVGNVWEWCADWYAVDAYRHHAAGERDPTGPRRDGFRVLRGGSFLVDRDCARCAVRYRDFPGYRNSNRGFRVVVVSPGSPTSGL